MNTHSIEEIVEDLAEGKLVIIVDDEDRENEGDILMLASHVRPEDINFMVKYGRGLVCLTLTKERCRQLDLPLMVETTNDRHGTNFTVSIEASEGVTTGISAYDRAHTVRTAVAPNAQPVDVVQPGHIFPIMAQPGGVLTRAGHTEAGCDLARIAGSEPSAVIVEILNEDGTMARRPDLEIFAKEHGLKIGTIADLIHYRIKNESTVKRVANSKLMTEFGEFDFYAYQDDMDDGIHYALTIGDLSAHDTNLVRVHLKDEIADIVPVNDKRFGWPLRDAMRRIAEEGSGAAVILRQPASSAALLKKIIALGASIDTSIDSTDEKSEPEDLRTYGIGAQILTDLGISKMKLLSSPKNIHALSGFGLEVVDYIWDVGND